MIYRDFQDMQLPLLGFGCMRLPTRADGSIDQEQLREMVRCAMDHGVNYFDTAWPYHGGSSETALGQVLAEYPRESFYLATKYPGHQISSTGYDPASVFEEQLRKCGVEYFDFYLLHNVYEKSSQVYLDPQWGIIDYFLEQKRLGRIRYLGFSTHSRPDNLGFFLDQCGQHMDFCQIQLNYLDWTLQDAKTKYEMLLQRKIPIWVMEPVRGGKLAALKGDSGERLRSLRPDESIPAWAFRFLQDLPGVNMILSGMSNMDQLLDNLKTFADPRPLSREERELLLEIAEREKDAIPCTACRYCCDNCPMGLDIPMLLGAFNEVRYLANLNVALRIEAIPEEKRASACIGYGQCAKMCPQNINIPQAMRDFTAAFEKLPSWVEICRKREESAAKG